ncbi:uncharacterized protein BDZ99DRAFT_457344 [Mytilinidion resinicola]|uniref:FAD-binding FR-type domain-containing protein n=1 Tax=Mytilinidion resinicola TaxID=574789 RepID=A0A6A6ZA99_9PEZI|nr:uncharacterized protein BDZ99DRAFT_457344 [Mytilinidion resinicola]KAF2817619.1 hypothetical protein BDZ99DRAFT_457344 [Mytilinidion resinicola]
MAFGYSFVNLSEAEKLQRRELLDLYAATAQWSILIVFAVFQLSFLLSWLLEPRAEERPKSPFGKPPKLKGPGWIAKAQHLPRSLSWWAGAPLAEGWGTRAEWIAGLAWTAWLLFLSVHQTGNDYLHLTKRFGIVGASQLPLHYLLAIRSKYSPPQLLTRLSHEQIKTAHQILGRIITFLFILHACFYLNFFILSGFLQKRIKDPDVIFGIVSIIMFITMNTTALNIIRKWSYRMFYTTHIVFASLLIIPLYFHVHHIRKYVLEVCVIIISNQALRNYSLRTYSGTISMVPGTNLVQVKVPLVSSNKEMKWKPGQHVYLSRPTGASTSFGVCEMLVLWNQTNPFTIASLAEQDKHLLLVVRTLTGNTKQLAKLARSLPSQDGVEVPSIPVALEGPYGSTSRLPDLTKFDRVLLVAGGVGATFIIPIYRSLVEHDGPSFRNSQLRFVWAVRKLAETQWAFPASRGDEDAESEAEGVQTDNEVEVSVTQPFGSDLQGENADDGMELAEAEHLIPFEEEMEKPRKGVVLRAGRPDVHAIVDEVFTTSAGSVAVITCGPRGMTEKLRESVGTWVKQGREVYWHNETFGW